MQEPTVEQAKELFRVCYQLTNMYCSIHLVRIDEKTNRIYILAGDETQLEIFPNGRVRYKFGSTFLATRRQKSGDEKMRLGNSSMTIDVLKS